MSLLQRLNKPQADIRPLDFDQWFDFNGTGYPFPMVNQTYAGGSTQEILPTFTGLGNALLARNGIVWACVTTRNMLFAEAVLQFRRKGQTGSNALYGKPSLQLLENPWPGGTTRKLLALLELHVQLAGNGYAYSDPLYPGTVRVLRPDWVTIILGSRDLKPNFEVGDASTEVIGYAYRPGGDVSRQTIILPDQMAHFMPHPDPIFNFRGASWLGPVIQEIVGDSAMTTHKNKFLENGATANMVVTLDPRINQTQFDQWVEKFDQHKGVMNAYKTIYLAGGADAKVVGANLEQIDFKAVQAHGETRICNAAGIPPIVVGVSEGLDSATYSNYSQARRAWADAKLRPMWAGICAELQKLVATPAGSELWYDERQIAFLAEDLKDQATILQTNATTLQQLIVAGWTPQSAQAYVETGDLSVLTHTGLYSIQLQPPGTTMPGNSKPANPNGLAALLCSLCEEPAGRNEDRCGRCAELAADLRTRPGHVTEKVAAQLQLTEHDAAVALGLKACPVPKLSMNGHKRDFLTPAISGVRLK